MSASVAKATPAVAPAVQSPVEEGEKPIRAAAEAQAQPLPERDMSYYLPVPD